MGEMVDLDISDVRLGRSVLPFLRNLYFISVYARLGVLTISSPVSCRHS